MKCPYCGLPVDHYDLSCTDARGRKWHCACSDACMAEHGYEPTEEDGEID